MGLFGNFLGVALSTASTLIPATPEVRSGKSTAKAHDFSFSMPNGELLELSAFSGKPILIVNTATKCGFSNQLGDLQRLHERYADEGLIILGVPSNDFGRQEPLADGDVSKHCNAEYGAGFPITAKTSVKGETAHPFFHWARNQMGKLLQPHWNFHKYLISPDGSIVGSFPAPVKPTSARITRAIERQLDK